MKKMKSLFAVLFAVTCISSMSCVAFAQTLTPVVEMPPVVSESSDVSGASSDMAEEVQSEESATEPLPQVVEIDPEEYAAAVGQSGVGGEQESEEILTEQADPAEGSSNNTMYFVGAGAAVLLLAGVVVFCKTKGKQ